MAALHGTHPGPAQGREFVERNQNMLEPCTWELNTQLQEEGLFEWMAPNMPRQAPAVLAPAIKARLRSVRSTEDCIINFSNESEVPVRAIWLDFNGNEVQYTVIEPKAQRRYRTFATHPWIIREVATGQRMMLGQRMVVFGTAGEEVKSIITPPPPIPWNLGTHKFYPAAFKKLVQVLLLSHNRVRCSDNSWLLKDLCLNNLNSALRQQQLENCQLHRASAPSKAEYMEGRKEEHDTLLRGQYHSTEETSNSFFSQGQPIYVCLETVCNYSGFCPPSLRSQASTCLSLDSESSAAVTATSNSSVATEDWQGSSSSAIITATAADLSSGEHKACATSCAGCNMLPASDADPCQEMQPVPLSEPTPAESQHVRGQQAQRAQHAQHEQQTEQEEASSPRAIIRMLGWVVDKVTKVAKPMCAPKAQMLSPWKRDSSDGPIWRGSLTEMSELPTHLVLRIISLMAPTNVPQCVSYGEPEAYPDILPAMLESDPATWPEPPPAIPLADNV